MPARFLLVTADDFGIGDETSRGILDLAERGIVTSTVLLVNSPHAESGIRLWKSRGKPVELGWHPCLTLDSPVLPSERVPTLVDATGKFLQLGTLMPRLFFGRVNTTEIEAELLAQYERFRELVGEPPRNVNAHHHVHIFPPVREALLRVLARQVDSPFVRRVMESPRTLLRLPGGRLKRAILSMWGRTASRYQQRASLPGADELLGVTSASSVKSPDFFTRWLHSSSRPHVELTCHPGHWDATLEGRDGTATDGLLERRVWELKWLGEPSFSEAANAAGFQLVTAAELARQTPGVRSLPRSALKARFFRKSL